MATVEQKYDEAIQLEESGKLEEAVGKLEALVSEAPDYALAYAGLSAFYSKMDRHDEAVEHAQKVCELEPEDPFSFMAMSLVCQKAGRLPEAELALNQAMEKQWAAGKDPQG
ncbi:MAG: tetratricopeptide repeat protein [Planctomycetota bacterium]|jgi:tetratricopeptide (TPR) repeat protein